MFLSEVESAVSRLSVVEAFEVTSSILSRRPEVFGIVSFELITRSSEGAEGGQVGSSVAIRPCDKALLKAVILSQPRSGNG